MSENVPKGKPLVDVLTGKLPSRRPIWLMRQAGRYLPEYQKVRAQAGSFLRLCDDSRLAFEVSMQPLRRYDLDAAIVFADILLIARALGSELDFRLNEGPVLSPVRSSRHLQRLKRDIDVDDFRAVFDTITMLRRNVDDHQAVIGFCGAPWTVASYMIEGRSVRERVLSKRIAMENPPWFEDLMNRLVESSIAYLSAQAEAGADVVQIFDSWAGDLPESVYERLVYEPVQKIIEGFHRNVGAVPVIGFARGLGAAHKEYAVACRPNAVSVEQSVPLDWIRTELVPTVVVQGNLDPMTVVIGGDVLRQGVARITSSLPAHSHIFNLGHGVRQETEPAHVEQMIAYVRDADGARLG
jgi:uroporphyrinogen decarboxylase